MNAQHWVDTDRIKTQNMDTKCILYKADILKVTTEKTLHPIEIL